MNVMTGIRARRFVVVGRVGMDLFTAPGVTTEDADAFQADMGGSSANIAAGLVKLGAQAALVTSVSDDAIGSFCLSKLDQYGIDATHVRRVTGEPRTSVAIYESRTENHRNVVYRNNAADFQMTVADVESVDWSQYSALITAGTVFAAEPSRSAAFRAFDLARAAGLPIIFDVDYRPYSWPSPQVASDVLSRAGALSDVIVGNDDEFGFMAGDKAKGLDKARALVADGAAIAIYKMGEHGAITITADGEDRSGIFRVNALKPTGAGDSFMAGLLASLADGCDLRTAVLRGSACAAIVVARPGCAPAMPDRAGLDAFLSQHPGPTEG
ncbi:5-dehydro-2-deoxygluconokinase [Loktanella sp. SALINAS62]|uniref:5-dehydro-2-deoxygluconokinase n=1 Tax=Loktanella sp. SALINAS62 TaxID=2706124 RepID=UPI001B8B7E82|nr:5-dehydro-2-deoxygluconokinase [Loktanella sp. SALINAS62]MBS1302556.1 5-dehydro-2-deoxygluconokinase [Loktanella sp. SALINAS62]